MGKDVIIENRRFVLTVGEDCVAKSLVLKENGRECLAPGAQTALFSLTEERPYNNEIKLAYPTKRTTFQANRLRREGNRLIVGFELLLFEAVVEIREENDYVAFQLKEFPVDYGVFGLDVRPLPVAEFRMLQLSVANTAHFGEWLNAMWDDQVAVNVLATGPFARIDSEKRNGYRVLTADALRDVELLGCSAALIVSSSQELLDCVQSVEKDYGLPSGVKSRRDALSLNTSLYHVRDLDPTNVDQHIAYAKQGGFRMMLVYYKSMFRETVGYTYCGDYDFRDTYPNGYADLKAMLDKIRAAGIIPGIHILQTHIGVKSRYVTPALDHRLNLVRHFTLSRDLGPEDDVIYVEQKPTGVSMSQLGRVLQFGKEAIEYRSYVDEYPYRFVGCKRGHYGTQAVAHEKGLIGGLLDVSEYGGTSVYLDPDSSLQIEIAQKIARAYEQGFEFVYFDGSEGAKPPYEIFVPYAQYQVYRQLDREPLFCEGAAKSHFSWHMLSGGNAFDVFPMDIFKEKIAQYPMEEAPRMADDFTRVNFGWWDFNDDTMPDIYEYGTSKAAGWDCPITVRNKDSAFFQSNPRTADVLEVLRRWEDVRQKGWLSQEQKLALQDPDTEHTLLIDENGEYELVEYEKLPPVPGLERISAFVFERKGRAYLVCWDTLGTCQVLLPDLGRDTRWEEQLGKPLPLDRVGESLRLCLGPKRYLSASLTKKELIAAFSQAQLAQ